MKLKVANKEIDIVVERKKIKNMYLRIKEDYLLVTVHPSVPLHQIEEFVLSRKKWIEKALQENQRRQQQVSKGATGPILYLFGEKKYVRYEISSRNHIEVDEDIMTFYLKDINDQSITSTFEKFAKPLLMKVLDAQRDRWDRVIQDYQVSTLPTFRIRTMTSQWGNCMMHKSLITMNLSLIHFPIECIDYVLWHEYVHLLVPNHSKRFYEIVEYHMPDYKKYKNMLK